MAHTRVQVLVFMGATFGKIKNVTSIPANYVGPTDFITKIVLENSAL